ncbi:membrane-associated Zn-dependent protease [Candidatus Blochmanniella floridana]|uniref:Zinc metalloprotease n=1 Tax=Blochmanniella floridana TaxID=203907 RepID=Q7VRD9_BLOFL|nr:membrane-associated Zn-dependent protease [Candidatus Blochmannia floridanus]
MVLDYFWNIVFFILTISLLITVHECGHFLAARFFGVKVEKFSIGFGPIVWSWQANKDSTEYIISIIPLGGYVKLLDKSSISSDSESYHTRNDSFHSKDSWKRGIIIAMGPIFNIIFSIILYTLVFMIGVPVYKPIINYIFPNSIVEKINIPVGSEIKSINGIKTVDWESVRLNILHNINKEKIVISTICVNNDEIYEKSYVIPLSINWLDKSIIKTQDPIIALGVLPCIFRATLNASEIKLHPVSEQDTLQINDKILLINKLPIYNWQSLIQIVKNNSGQSCQLVVERDKHLLYLNVVLIDNYEVDSGKFLKNINFFLAPDIVCKSIKPVIRTDELFTAILKACNKTIDLFIFTVNALFQLVSGNVRITNLHGPIAIAQGAGKSIHSGINYYLMFLAVVSINLGLINLFPIPILDGGQLCFLLIEKIKGSPLSKKIQNFSYIISFAILILIMVLTTYNDITR